ncbi:hypothetical protein [Zophobihabitans entericus]|uniref:Uncharacterized protein n=1 Tax=Zophobihabitans entericus TaxID=1635327 RepID=A0A6G9I9U8_9GAMM|nr:hypothetical protein [Zophobihabitans entericus]QIQ21005.1 hypothetical protein IPMB12_04505 [Zophobihabitans entericus]
MNHFINKDEKITQLENKLENLRYEVLNLLPYEMGSLLMSSYHCSSRDGSYY